MRVVSGSLGGRLFDSPRTHRTHPMSEKARGALFNTLGDIHGLRILDAYAGSGAITIEAVSRGAQHVTAIDIDVEAIRTIASNVQKLAITEQVLILRKNISGWSKNNQHKKYEVVIADPPYSDIRPDVIERLEGHLLPGGIMVVSWPKNEMPRAIKNTELLAVRPLGDIQLIFYKNL